MTSQKHKYARQQTRLFYQQELKEIIHEAEGSQGYISIHTIEILQKKVSELQQRAQKLFDEGNYYAAVEISTAVIEEISPAINFTDDCKGVIVDVIGDTFLFILDISRKEINEETRKYLFEYLLSVFRKRTFIGWDWYFQSLQITFGLACNLNEIKKIRTLLDGELVMKQHRQETEHYIDLLEKRKLELAS